MVDVQRTEPQRSEDGARRSQHNNGHIQRKPENLEAYDAPVVLTINPGKMTDIGFYRIHTNNLMFVRFRANTWNKKLQQQAIQYYAEYQTTIVLTFMAYFETANKIPQDHRINYIFRKRTLNHYWAITA